MHAAASAGSSLVGATMGSLPKARSLMSPHARHAAVVALAARAAALAAIVVLVVGGIPGGRLRLAMREALVDPVPADVRDRDGSLEVTVRAAADGAAPGGGPLLRGARVRAFVFIDDRAYLADSRETDAAGRARLDRLPHGVAWVVADAPGRARASTRLVIEAEMRRISFELLPEHLLDVAVKDDEQAPVVDAQVEVVAQGDPLPIGARSQSDGVAHVSRLPPGPWRLTARAPGYEEAAGTAEHEGERVTIVLRKLGSLSIQVVDTADAPVADARVAVAGAMLWPPRATETDGEGRVRIGGLSAGVYALRASRGDLVSAIELGVPLARGEQKSVVLKVAPGRWVAVRVTDGEGDDADGIAASRVTLAEGGLSPFPIEATTDSKGRARLGPVSYGPATLSVRADGFVPRGGLLLSDPPPPETRVVLVRSGTVSGRVVDDRGFPIDGATIEIIGTDPSGAPILDDPRRASFQVTNFDAMLGGPVPLVPGGELGVMPGAVPPVPRSLHPSLAQKTSVPLDDPWVTSSDGTFRASPVSPGRVRALVRHPQYLETQSAPVVLVPGGEAYVDVVMRGGGGLEGRVVDSRDRPVPGARVLVSALRGTLERVTRTASDGTFAFASLPDRVSLTASTDDEDQPDAHVVIAVAENARGEVTVRLPEPRGALEVHVVDERDWPIEAAQVTASSLSADSPLRTTAFTDSHGDASLKRARGLPLRIEAGAPGRAPHVVTSDANATEVRIELPAAETAIGEVVAARGGDAIAGAEVAFLSDAGVRRTHTDKRGAFGLRELAPGTANLRVVAPGFASAERPIKIPDSGGGRPFPIPTVELAAEGIVEGEVVDTRGAPVAGARIAKDSAPTWLVVGVAAEGTAVADSRGLFSLRQLAEGTVTLEAYAPDLGRARVEGVRVTSGRTTSGVRIVLGGRPESEPHDRAPEASGNVAITLSDMTPTGQIEVTAVAPGSEAERAGVMPGDVLVAVDDTQVHTVADARERLAGPLADDVIVKLRRAERDLTVTVAREAVRR